ncbi:hypothetical protein BRD15_03745 [Halobacteriales archaeon SW_6_65_15]|nr:MAG: hypothetical protein BRD15_03745 [Halobacteriales archaeon SW_6_65_15]
MMLSSWETMARGEKSGVSRRDVVKMAGATGLAGLAWGIASQVE